MVDIEFTIQEEKAIADDLLNKFRIYDPSCIVAGGAPRDWYYNICCNDIDLYVNVNVTSTHQNWKTLIRLLMGDQNLVINDVGRDYEEIMSIDFRSVVEFEYRGKEIQIMRWNKPTYEVVDSFCCDLSKFWYCYGSPLVSFNTLRRLDDGICHYFEGTKPEYMEKISAYFPDFQFVEVPDTRVNLRATTEDNLVSVDFESLF